MASPNYDTASTYLNNLLLARGLLTDGRAIPFTTIAISVPQSEKCDSNEEVAQSITGRIINLIHDLVLRRDRDASQKEALTSTIRTLRGDEAQHLLHVQKLQDKNATLQGQLNTVEGQIRLYKQEIKRCEKETKHYVEQNTKLKSTLDQTRAKCISDIRARDIELNKLKNIMAGLNRGAKKEFDPKNTRLHNLKNSGRAQSDRPRRTQGSVSGGAAEDSVFGQESPEMLSALLNETSTENVALRKMIADTMDFLKSLTDMDLVEEQKQGDPLDEFGSAIGIPGQYRNLHNPAVKQESTASEGSDDVLTPVSVLGQDMSKVLQHCQVILKDPSFVPIEEVQVREKEIEKLKAGWEKMADRWREAVGMMGTWRREMMGQDGIDPISGHRSFEEVQEQLDDEHDEGQEQTVHPFKRSIALRPDGRPVLDPIEEEEFTSMLEEHRSRLAERSILSSHIDEIHDYSLAEPDATSTPKVGSSFRGQSLISVTEEGNEDTESSLDLKEAHGPEPTVKTIASPARRGIKLPQSNLARQPLDSSNTNARKRKESPSQSVSSPKRRTQSTEFHNDHDSTYMSSTSTSTSTSNPTPPTHDSSTDPLHLSDIEDDTEKLFTDDLQVTGESTATHHRMTVAEKLAAIEAEATEATEVIRRKQALVPDEKRARARDRRSGVGAVGGKEKTERKERMGKAKARDRRRSTLTPAELGALMR